jgi:hypothetical protein
MKRMKWAFILASSLVVQGVSANADQDELLLKAKLEESVRKDQRSAASVGHKWQKIVKGIKAFQSKAGPTLKMCKDARHVLFAQKYAMSFDENNQPCRIYDLSFPNLKAMFSGKSVSQLPVQKMKAKDYLAWLKGDYEAVNQSMETFKTDFDLSSIAKNSWVSQLKFRNPPMMVGAIKGEGGLPESFHASDLDFGNRFRFSETDRNAMKGMFGQIAVMSPAAFGGAETQDFWMTLADQPESLLKMIRFDWNDARKIYEVFLEADFLPISGPVALVDYQAQYKMTVEKMIRTAMRTALRSLVQYVPAPVVARLLDVAIVDSFEMVELMYDYQLNQLEDTLRTAAANGVSIGADAAQTQQGMNILFGSRSDLMSEYIMAVAQGRVFDWQAIDKIGRMTRYTTEKRREIQTTKMFSQLVSKKGCTVEVMHAAFGVCSKDGKKSSMHSLLSEHVVVSWSLGAPLVHRYGREYEVTLMRSTSWLLGAGVRMFQLPYIGFLSKQLSYVLKGFATAGMTDEAILRNDLWMKKGLGQLDAENTQVLKWLYIQNINPFLPKSEAMEKSVIDANLRLLNAASIQ